MAIVIILKSTISIWEPFPIERPNARTNDRDNEKRLVDTSASWNQYETATYINDVDGTTRRHCVNRWWHKPVPSWNYWLIFFFILFLFGSKELSLKHTLLLLLPKPSHWCCCAWCKYGCCWWMFPLICCLWNWWFCCGCGACCWCCWWWNLWAAPRNGDECPAKPLLLLWALPAK